jgi:A/G-specific adenine glycosylase
MGQIEWIDHTLEQISDSVPVSTVDLEDATRIARNEDLGIRHPEENIEAFIDDLPDLFDWFETNYRDFPWRRRLDPWSVLVAEILLQRTHASAVDQIYPVFMQQYPGPEAVVRTDRDELFETVEPLGFGNKRTRTIKQLSETMIDSHGGQVPEDLGALQDLPRIGPYTARACLCFAYGHPLSLIDANVAAVVTDVFGYESSARPHKDDALYAFLDALIPKEPDLARIFNLAILDLRVKVCADQPGEFSCPLGQSCSVL